MGEKLIFVWSRDQFLDKREKRLHFSVGLGSVIGKGLEYDSGSGFASKIRAQGLQK